MYMNTQRLQRGLSLVEVFVALLVLSVGLIALAKLQVDLVRGSSDARTRTVALALAEEKIEDLRTFAVAEDSGTWSTTVNPMAWSYITGPALTTPPDMACTTACRGGRIAPQTSYSSALEVAGVRFKRTWEVDQRDFTNAGPPAITSRTKDVRVTIAWMNELGVEQQVSVLGNLVDIPPGNVALASQPLEERPAGPQIAYTPGEAPEVIAVPIDTGTGKRETTKPIPTIKKTADSTLVTFDVVNYNSDTNTVSRREEFITLNCKCTFIDGTHRGRTPAKVVLVGNTMRDEPGKIFEDKVVGIPRDSLQPSLCDICCRDHHDYSDGTNHYRYNPEINADHAHYLKPNLNSAVTSGDYDEACRLKRVNGIFQVFEDWNLRTLTVLPKTDIELNGPKVDDYVQAVQDYVITFANAKANNTTPPSALDPNIFEPSAVSLDPTSKQLLARAIYVDNMPDDLLAKIDAILSDADTSNDASVLSLVPFYEVHLTKLADWISQDTAKTTAKVTSNAIPDQNNVVDSGVVNGAGSVYSRGLVQPQTNAQIGNTTIIATARRYNTGVTNTPPINTTEDDGHPTQTVTPGPYYYTDADPETTPPAEHRDGWMPVNFAGGIAITGSFEKAKFSPLDPVAGEINPPSGSNGASCVTDAVSSGIESFSCTVPLDWSGTITFSGASGYSFCYPEDDSKKTPLTPCTPGFLSYAKVKGSISAGNIYVWRQ